ncbi:vitamin K epoxide reductase family protein [Williamsia sp. SKLECPSW1]
MDDDIDRRPGRVASAVVVLGGAVGLLAAATLTIERFKLFADPGYRPSCSINPIISCGSVMTTEQAAFFGFPNPIIGIAAFAVVIVLGVLAFARVAIPAWVWAGLALGLVLGLVFVGYLITQSLYRIGALCPYCMAVWVVTPLLFATVVGILARATGNRRVVSAAGWVWPVLIIAYTAVVLMIAERFWDYWSTLI